MSVEYFVDPAKPDNTGNGLTIPTAKKTIAAGIALCTAKNDILSLLPGNHVWTVAGSGTAIPASTIGTSFTDYGTLIRGIDASGNPAMATVYAPTISGVRTLVRVGASTGYVIFRNIIFDSSLTPTDSDGHNVCEWHYTGGGVPGPVRFEGCSLIGANIGTRPAVGGSMFSLSSLTPPLGTDAVEIDHCYFQNHRIVCSAAGIGGLKVKLDHCVSICDWTATGAPLAITQLGNGHSASGLYRFKNCTIFWDLPNTSVGPGVIQGYLAPNGFDVGVVDVYNNFIFLEPSVSANDAVLFKGSGSAAVVTNAGTVGYNVFIGGVGITSAIFDPVFGPYEEPWGTPNAFPVTDTVNYGVAATTAFANTAATYAWDALRNGVAITINKDLRLRIHASAGLLGALPGALPPLTSPPGRLRYAHNIHVGAAEAALRTSCTGVVIEGNSFAVTENQGLCIVLAESDSHDAGFSVVDGNHFMYRGIAGCAVAQSSESASGVMILGNTVVSDDSTATGRIGIAVRGQHAIADGNIIREFETNLSGFSGTNWGNTTNNTSNRDL